MTRSRNRHIYNEDCHGDELLLADEQLELYQKEEELERKVNKSATCLIPASFTCLTNGSFYANIRRGNVGFSYEVNFDRLVKGPLTAVVKDRGQHDCLISIFECYSRNDRKFGGPLEMTDTCQF
jgi:hypothetical protein